MTAETDIVNVALRLIGAQPITSLSDGTKSANAADDIYTELLDDVLRTHNWNFATKRQKLARSSTAPAFEFDYAYAVPSDWLKTVSVHDNDAGTGTLFYREELVADQRVICTSASEVYLRYIGRVTDPNLMPADFRRVFQTALARDLAVPVASSNTLADLMARDHRRALARARSGDAMGSFPEQRPRGSWASSRGGRWPRGSAGG
jgi:hypothetical protein